jgi:hypothetical protein
MPDQRRARYCQINGYRAEGAPGVIQITLRQAHFSIDLPPRFGDQMASKVEGVVDGACILSVR